MNKYNTVFGQLLSLIKRPEFNRLCREHESNKYSKGFSAWNELSELQPAAKKAAEQTLHAVDATTIGLRINDFPRAKFRSTKSGVKIHVKYDAGKSVQEYLFITNADNHENSTLGSMKLKEVDVVTFDR